MNRCCTSLLFAAVMFAALGGCHDQTSQVAPPQPPAVPVSRPVQQEVTDYVDFTGQTDAVQAVNVEARVTGYLVRMPFKEGSEVRGDGRPLTRAEKPRGQDDRGGPCGAWHGGGRSSPVRGLVNFRQDRRFRAACPKISPPSTCSSTTPASRSGSNRPTARISTTGRR